MKLSAPVYRLKREAKRLSRKENIPLHEALDRIAAKEGFRGWSLLTAKAAAVGPASKLFAGLQPGDLLLIGARPGQGKTLLSLELAVEAMKAGRRCVFFSLEYTEQDVRDRFRALGVELVQFGERFAFDSSDEISAAHVVKKLQGVSGGTLAVIDYLQLLDQKRNKPDLAAQIRMLKSFARDSGSIMVFISQIDRSYDPRRKPFPGLEDVRLPNPLDLKLFDKTCFLNGGEVEFRAAG